MTVDRHIAISRHIKALTGQEPRLSIVDNEGIRLDIGGTVHVIVYEKICWFGDDDGGVGSQFDDPLTLLANPLAWSVPRWLGRAIDDDFVIC